MQTRNVFAGCILIAVLGLVAGCHLPGTAVIKILMLADGDFDDDSFNESCQIGLARAVADFGVTAELKVVDNMTTIEDELEQFIAGGYDLIIANGFLFADAVADAASNHPDTRFALIDYAFDSVPANVNCVVFASDEAAFPLGYLASAWSMLQDADNASVAYVGGLDIEPVRQWTDSFCSGADYYNSAHGAAVACGGSFVGDFYNEDGGKEHAEYLISGGANVILGCGGLAGNGSLDQASDMGAWGMGVDQDMYYVLTSINQSILSSGIKRFDNGVYAAVQSVVDDSFEGGGVYEGDLANGGVALAPYHDFDDLIPDDVQSEIEDILADIKNGDLQTGWE